MENPWWQVAPSLQTSEHHSGNKTDDHRDFMFLPCNERKDTMCVMISVGKSNMLLCVPCDSETELLDSSTSLSWSISLSMSMTDHLMIRCWYLLLSLLTLVLFSSSARWLQQYIHIIIVTVESSLLYSLNIFLFLLSLLDSCMSLSPYQLCDCHCQVIGF